MNKGPYSQSYGFSRSHIWMWELNCKEGWEWKSLCFWTVMLENTLQSPLDSNEIKPNIPKGKQPWIFIGRTDAEAEAPIPWPPDAKSELIRKDPDAGKYWRQEKRVTEDEMIGWHPQFNGHEFEQAAGAGDGQEAWHAAVHGITKSRMQLSNWSELIVWKDSMKKKTTDQYSLWKWVQKSLTKC